MPRRTRKIDFKSWNSLPGLSSDAVAADGLLTGTALAFTEPSTILRMRSSPGIIAFDESVQVGDTVNLGIGIGIVSSDAFAAGVGSLPDPIGDITFPWLWLFQADLLCTVAIGDQAFGMTTRQTGGVDSRAMRKMAPGQSLVQIFEFQGVSGAPVVLLETTQVRVLIGQ